MTELQHSLFSLPSPEKKLTNHASRIKYALEVYSARGLTLEAISSPRVLGRKPSTLKAYCCKFLIQFPDYVPFAMREKKIGKKEKRPRVAKAT